MTKKLMKLGSIMLAVLLCVSLLLTACGGGGKSSGGDSQAPAQQGDAGKPADSGKTYTLKFIASWPKGNINYDRLEVFKEEIEKLSEGRIIIDIVGGSDVIPANESAEAVMNGVVDGAYTSVGYFANYIPEAEVISVSNMTFAEMLASGGIDYLNKNYFEKNNLYLHSAGNEVELTPFNIYMKDPVKSLADLKGKKIRSSPGFLNEVVTAIGAAATPLAISEVFSALEQNLIDGFTAPSFIGGEQGFFQYAKYMIMPGFLRPGGVLIINKTTLDSLPEDLQKLIWDSAEHIVQAWDDKVDKTASEDNIQYLLDAGGQIVELPENEAAEFTKLTIDVGMKIIEQRAPEHIDELRKLFVK